MSDKPTSAVNPAIIERRKKLARHAIEDVFSGYEQFAMSHVDFNNDDHQDKIPNAIVTVHAPEKPSETFTIHIPLCDMGEPPYYDGAEMKLDCRTALERHASKCIPRFRQYSIQKAKAEKSKEAWT